MTSHVVNLCCNAHFDFMYVHFYLPCFAVLSLLKNNSKYYVLVKFLINVDINTDTHYIIKPLSG